MVGLRVGCGCLAALSASVVGQAPAAKVAARVVAVEPEYRLRCYETLQMRFDTLADAGVPGSLDESTPSPRNPHLDWRLQLRLRSPSGVVHGRPGFYAGDGEGGAVGDVWIARFVPDEVGVWTVAVAFRYGPGINVDRGAIGMLGGWPDGASFEVVVEPARATATRFRRHGPVRVDRFHLRHADGTQWLKAGSGSPENLLAYRGFHRTRDYGGDGTPFVHGYAAHAGDWRPGDPDWSAEVFVAATGGAVVVDPQAGRNIVGALSFLASTGADSIYFLPMNLGGDGSDTTPFVAESGAPTAAEQLHYSVARMHQWGIALEHAIDVGLGLEIVLAEREVANVTMLGAADSVPRRLFVRQLVAMFGHHPALRWIVCEENSPEPNLQFTVAEMQTIAETILAHADPARPQRIAASVDRMQNWDPLPLGLLEQIFGDPDYSGWLNSISLQIESPYSGPDVYGDFLELIRARLEDPNDWNATATIHLDESGPPTVGINYGRNFMRRWLTWDVYASRGYLSLYAGTLDRTLDDFRTRDYPLIYRDAATAAGLFMRYDLAAFEDVDGRLRGGYLTPRHGPAEIARIPGVVYIGYFPSLGGTALQVGDLDLGGETGRWTGRWLDPATLAPRGGGFAVSPGSWVDLDATVPAGISLGTDLVLLLDRG
jgi:hypothetical protein